uniref:hypothetical protein n=1 Tax=Poriella subacida TaxID=2872513 RepID=UPI003001BCD0|nr:hypothetical protein [Poriella subacida]
MIGVILNLLNNNPNNQQIILHQNANNHLINTTTENPIDYLYKDSTPLKEIVSKIFESNILENIQSQDIGIFTLILLSFSLVYFKVVKLYVNSVHGLIIPKSQELLLQRSKNIKSFMIYGALPIAYYISTIANASFNHFLYNRLIEVLNQNYTKETLLELSNEMTKEISNAGVLYFFS